SVLPDAPAPDGIGTPMSSTPYPWDRAAAQAAFSGFLSDQSLTPPQIRFVEMIIDQLTARGVMEASALYEAPFSSLHAGGPDELFAGKEVVIDELFSVLDSMEPQVVGKTG
ncbi:MAG: type I restriction-modification enzyme R subunit C-terminal domain-containing protein, partial [Arenicellales bacterium]|nr:type I restriction-modification enzyme R subunit C-terminal domain-containing protein [Arenicellales bacterium]